MSRDIAEAWSSDADEEGDDDGDLLAKYCFHCEGEGWTECRRGFDDCLREHKAGLCRCASCGGSGLAKDMTIW